MTFYQYYMSISGKICINTLICKYGKYVLYIFLQTQKNVFIY